MQTTQLRTLTIFAMGIIATVSQAQTSRTELKHGMTDIEIAMLPDYCRARLVGDEATKAAWSQRIGNDKFIHLHHYCSGLGAVSRAKVTIDRKKKSADLELADKEFSYVLRNWPADFPLAKDAQDQRARLNSLR